MQERPFVMLSILLKKLESKTINHRGVRGIGEFTENQAAIFC
jgi:hypothetical protein